MLGFNIKSIGLFYCYSKNIQGKFINLFKQQKSYLHTTCYSVNQSKYNSTIKAMGALSPLDPSSFSRPELAIVKHVSLDWNINFDKKIIDGAAVLDFKILKNTDEIILDVSQLTIDSVETSDGTALQYNVGEHVSNFGSKMTISLPKTALSENILSYDSQERSTKPDDVTKTSLSFDGYYYKFDCFNIEECDKNKTNIPYRCKSVRFSDKAVSAHCCKENESYRLKIKIKYKTSENASALQWLEPSQTSGKKHPYLFSQCQPIHARSIMPIQDTPAVKFTYDATVSAPSPLTVVMSALRQAKPNGASFNQPIPVPAYLVAVAAGALEQRTLGPRTVVWSEAEEIERSAWEFAETEKYLQAAEKLCGPYVWTQYDLLVLPPSFPYGGMENPCLTFVTPTLLAGDRSQADVIVHEIMHSWTGNLVTNRNFEHFWLNEGFTVFLERKVAASLISDKDEAKKSRDFHSLLGLQELNETVTQDLGVNSPLTQLVVDLNGVHPDDAFSTVPYEKGSLFLRYLEDLFGGPDVFDEFMRSYLNKFQKQSIDTDQFKNYLVEYFKDNENLHKIEWDRWLNKPGMPIIIPDYDTSMTKSVTALLAKIFEENTTLSQDDIKSFSPHQIINFLQELIERKPLSASKLQELGATYKIDASKNSEILYRWLRLCIKSKNISKLGDVFDFVNGQGRMKYVRPVYRDLYAWEEVRQKAIDNFLENESNMMHVTAYTLMKDLHLSKKDAE